MNDSQGSNRYIPVFDGLMAPKHIKKLGIAVFLFIELLSRTKGKPRITVTYRELQDQLGKPIRTLENWMNRLREGNYISVEGKTPMVITIKKYRLIKDRKIQPLPESEIRDTNPPKMVGSNPQDLVGQENRTNPPKMVGTSPKMVGSNPPTPLKPETSKPSLKNKKKRESLSPKKSSDSKPKAGKKTNPDIKAAIDHYHDEFLRIHGFKPQINGAAAKTFQRLLERDGGRSLGNIKGLITAYLSLSDQKLKDKGFPVTWFPESINGILMNKKQSEELEVSL